MDSAPKIAYRVESWMAMKGFKEVTLRSSGIRFANKLRKPAYSTYRSAPVVASDSPAIAKLGQTINGKFIGCLHTAASFQARPTLLDHY
jgi:hypothetical protein